MQGKALFMAGGLALLAGCTSVGSSGVIAMGPDTYGMKVTSRNLGGAAEKGLTDATTFCNSQGRQTQLMRTQITNEDYQLIFRCVGGAPQLPAAQPVQPAVPTIAGVPIPNPNAPTLPGPAFTQRPIVPADPILARAAARPAIAANGPILLPPAAEPPPPRTLPPLGATPLASTLQPLTVRPPSINTPPQPALESPVAIPAGERSWFSRTLGFWRSEEQPTRAEAPLPPAGQAGLPLAPISAPVGGLTGLPGSTGQPVPPPLPAGNPLLPLQSPLQAPIGTPALPATSPVLPLSTPAPPQVPVPPGLGGAPAGRAAPIQLRPQSQSEVPAPLAAPAAAQPAPQLPAALAPLPASAPVPAPLAPPARRLDEVPLQPLPRLRSDVPATLPPPAPAAAGDLQPVAAPSTTPPSAFWETRRN